MTAHLRLTTMEFWAENKALNCECERCDQDTQKKHTQTKAQKKQLNIYCNTAANGNIYKCKALKMKNEQLNLLDDDNNKITTQK